MHGRTRSGLAALVCAASVSTCSHDGAAVVLLSWQHPETQEMASYLFEILKKSTGPTRLRLSLRPRKQEKFYPLNPFDVQHLQDALQMFEQAESAMATAVPTLHHQR